MSDTPARLVVVGGGSAGWLLACRLAATYGENGRRDAHVVLIEAPGISSVGVGEGTWPTMRATLESIGLSETDFLRTCHATFKQGTHFDGWRGGSGANDSYVHPFEPPFGGGRHNVGDLWRDGVWGEDVAYAAAVSPQQAACAADLAPKLQSTPEYKAILNYGYHLDAAALGAMLRDHGKQKLGIEHVQAEVRDVATDASGWIDSLVLDSGRRVAGDFFFDCTGFRSRLLNQALGVPFISLTKYLFVDRALAVQVPHAESKAPIRSMTRSTAHDAGWIWDIPLTTRRGVGVVYSDAHMDEQQAAQRLADYLGVATPPPFRSLQFEARHLSEFWRNNAVAVGLAAGFVEPLEASALMLIEATADWFVNRLPRTRDAMRRQAPGFNRTMTGYWQRIVDFLKFHYVLSERDTQFWRDNRGRESIPPDLEQRLELWQHNAPFAHDFRTDSRVFSWESYQYVHCGMQAAPNGSAKTADNASPASLLLAEFQLNRRRAEKALAMLPTNRQLMDRLAAQRLPAA